MQRNDYPIRQVEKGKQVQTVGSDKKMVALGEEKTSLLQTPYSQEPGPCLGQLGAG